MSTISEIIKDAHKKLQKLLENYIMSNGNVDDQQSWSNQFRQDFIRHSTAEELILFPAYEKYIKENNTELIHQSQRDHREMKKLLFILDLTTITDPKYRFIFDQLIELFHKHIQREQNQNLPKLEEVLIPDQSSSLANDFQQAKYSSNLKVYPTSSVNPPL
ncbi:unnamed protein product [Adineta ricciae]|uniref:Hemerythrin-like domain-containing protein n=1 Tax=Adineta ricciae TaxID=249248 RepID=A0A815JVX7_ADIRI|nr:unnamed protein product [Adineta ricciae]CAF1387505.1 unnamed protein product [Adineta ricciae]